MEERVGGNVDFEDADCETQPSDNIENAVRAKISG
jgi:hypothetical protein